MNTRSARLAKAVLKHGELARTSLYAVPRHLIGSRASGYIFYFPNSSSREWPSLWAFTEVESMADFKLKSYSKESQRRPESKPCCGPQQFYSGKEATEYTAKPRNVRIQTEMASTAMDIISKTVKEKVAAPLLVLDLGCGSGIHLGNSKFQGHSVIGVDISFDMLSKAWASHTSGLQPHPLLFDFIQADLRRLQCVKMGIFDAAVSISVLQWFFPDTYGSKETSTLCDFLTSVWYCLKAGAPAICQFYPRNIHDLHDIVNIVTVLDLFHGAIICTYPHQNEAKKLFLLLHKK